MSAACQTCGIHFDVTECADCGDEVCEGCKVVLRHYHPDHMFFMAWVCRECAKDHQSTPNAPERSE